MKIGIVGSGHIGSTLARKFAAAGHEVAMSNSRGPDTLRDLEADLGDRGHATTTEQAGRFGDVVVVSVPFKSYADIPADALAGKVVVDTTNYYPQRDGHFDELDSGQTTSSEMLGRRLPGARLVKAFNAIMWDSLRDKGQPSGDGPRIGIPISGDDAEAKQVVAGLVDEIGFEPVDAGPLGEGGRKHQPGTDVYTADLEAAQLRSRIAA
jgi:predicted dinucleotide-binding enzyme